MIAEKQSLREDILRRRKLLPENVVREKSRAIAEKLFATELFRQSRKPLVYLSTPDEVRTDAIAERAFVDGKRVCVPLVKKNKALAITLWPGPDAQYRRGPLGIREPLPDAWDLQDPRSLDLIIAPGLAFDAAGGRIGYGGGYFDRLFAAVGASVRRLALAFEFQVADKIPQEENDAPVHMLITEERVIVCDPALRSHNT